MDASTATAVRFNGTAATTFSVDSNLQITATVPAGATTGTISVTDAEGTGTSLLSFTVTAPPVPTVGAFLPVSGPVGTSVTIVGTGFTGASAVTFNGTASAVFSVDSDLQITTTVPAGATTGPVSVTTGGGTGSSVLPFTVTGAGAPVVLSFLPLSGPIGTPVTIVGTGFTGATDVRFNGTAATVSTVDSDTQIHATVPVGATTGPIAVTTPGGTATSLTPFTVTASARHERALTLRLAKARAKGRLEVMDGFGDCADGAKVRIQRRVHGVWRTVKVDTTDGVGRFSARTGRRAGVYRALAPKRMLEGGAHICSRAVSPTRRRA
jgi:hypothetical protein